MSGAYYTSGYGTAKAAKMKGPCRSHKSREAATLWRHCTYGGVWLYEGEIRSVERSEVDAGLRPPRSSPAWTYG